VLQGGLAFLGDQPVGHLQHRLARRVAGVVGDQSLAEGVQGDRLGDDVKGPSGGQLDVDVAEGFQPGTEFRRGAPYPLGHRADLATLAGEHGDDPVRLTQFVGA